MKIGFQIDELEKLNFSGDTSFIIMQEAIKRGFEVYFYYPFNMSYFAGGVYAKAYKVREIDLNQAIPIIYEEEEKLQLNTLDVIFLRQDPPFDMAYITSTFLLEKIMNQVKIINNPISVRNAPEKLFATEFYQFMPKTLITKDKKEIIDFVKKEGKAVIKPLHGHGGADVFLLEEDNFNLHSIIEYFFKKFREQIMVQEYLPNIKKGDKRIIMIAGEIAGAFSRIPPVEGIKSNLVQGGRAVKAPLTEKEKEICKVLAPRLKELELDIVGLDIIDDYLIEINVTSPTGFKPMIDLEGKNLAVDLLDFITQII